MKNTVCLSEENKNFIASLCVKMIEQGNRWPTSVKQTLESLFSFVDNLLRYHKGKEMFSSEEIKILIYCLEGIGKDWYQPNADYRKEIKVLLRKLQNLKSKAERE